MKENTTAIGAITIAVFTFATQVNGSTRTVHHDSEIQDSMNLLVDSISDKLTHRALKTWSIQRVNADDTTLGKPGHLAQPATSWSYSHSALLAPGPLGTSQALPLRNGDWVQHLHPGLHPPGKSSTLQDSQPRSKPCRQHIAQAIRSSSTQGDVDVLMSSISSSKDADAIFAACEALEAKPLPADSVEQLAGDWKVEWSDLGLSRLPKLLGVRKMVSGALSSFKPKIKLKVLSFGALPPVDVQIIGGWNRVSGSAEGGGIYELLQEFTIPDNNNVAAAMVLGGPWGKDESGEPGRAFVKFETVTILPSASDPDASTKMLKAAGLNISTPVPVKAPPTYIDVEYIDGAVRVHKGASGSIYVLSRTKDIPFN